MLKSTVSVGSPLCGNGVYNCGHQWQGKELEMDRIIGIWWKSFASTGLVW
jgi:hypothetical protein